MVAPKSVLLNHRKQVTGKTVYYYSLFGECSGFVSIDNNDKLSAKASSMYV